MVDEGARASRRDDQMPPWVRRAILFFFGVGLSLIVGWWLLIRLRGLLVMLLVALFLSFALEPAVNWLAERGWRRGAATLLVMFALLVVSLLFVVAIGSVLVNQVTDFVDEAPRYIDDTQDWINDTFNADVNFDDIRERFTEGGSANEFAADLGGYAVEAGATVVRVLFQMLTIALFTFYLVADGPRLRRAILSVLPKERQVEVLRVWEIAIEKTGGYIYSRSLLAFVSTVTHWIAFAVIGIPFPLPMALWVGLVSQFVPTIGTYIAGALPIAIALIDKPIDALWVLAVILVYQQIENYVIQPLVYRRAVALSGFATIAVVLAGGALLGVIGAILAVPVAASIKVVLSDLTAARRARMAALKDDQAETGSAPA
jgi:predicted PurR-regulated permease PerM